MDTNHLPALAVNGGAAVSIQGGNSVVVAPNLTVTDDDTNLQSATVTLSALPDGASESLSIPGATAGSVIAGTNITFVGYNSSTGVLSLSGVDTLSHYQQVLRSITYLDTSSSADLSTRSLLFVVTDAYGSSAPIGQNIIFDVPPTVMGVYVSGGDDWDPSFYDYLDSNGYGNSTVAGLGYNVSNGDGQLDTLPWLNLNTLNVLFSESVNVSQNSLQLIGPDSPDSPTLPSISGFSYNASTHVATWTFASSPLADRILLHFDAAAVTDAAGAMLDGYWNDASSSSTSGSGNGAQGSDFNFMMYVLPGDQLNQQTVTLADAKQIVPFINRSAGDAGYNYRMDVLGQGTITLADAKQIVPHINDDISGLVDPTAPAESNAAQSQNLSGFTIIAASGSPSVSDSLSPNLTANDSTAFVSADQTAFADGAASVIVSSSFASTEAATPRDPVSAESMPDLSILPPSSASDRTIAVDFLFADNIDWLTTPSSSLLTDSVSGVSHTLVPTTPMPILAAGPPAAVIQPGRSFLAFANDDDSTNETTALLMSLDADETIVPRRA